MKKVIITEYSDLWPEKFNTIASIINHSLGSLVLSIHHVGSTAVPGLCAKPIIDLDVVIEKKKLQLVIQKLEEINYRFQGDLGIIERFSFDYLGGDLPDHHLYVCDKNNEELRRHLVFRDYLRKNRFAREEYAEKKRELVAISDDRQKYIDGKAEVVLNLLKQALNETSI